MKSISTTLAILCVFAIASEAALIRTNQLGYYPQGPKVLWLVGAQADSFVVKDAHSLSIVYRGALGKATYWDQSDETVQALDFSNYQQEGAYVAEVQGVAVSDPFPIRKDVYAKAYKDIQRGFYYWRASTDIPAQYGGTFARGFGHPDSNLAYHDSLYKTPGARRDVRGGWYDAGDYGKYVVNAGMSVGLLQIFLAMHPTWSGDSVINLPESGNGRPDLLDEVRYELDWLLRMQDDDGGVFFKVTPKNFEAMVLPQNDKSTRYIIGKSTSSTLDFAAMLAQGYRRWKNVEPAFADTLLARSIHAYDWALTNKSIPYNQGAGTKYPDVYTGGYGDNNFTDEFLWAKTELWLSTGDAKYKPNSSELAAPTRPDWARVSALAVYSLALEAGVSPDASLQTYAQNLVIAEADKQYGQLATSAYHLPWIGFNWGSNGALASQSMCFQLAWQFKQDQKYLNAAIEIADYFFGKNPLGSSYATGIGMRSSVKPHSRIMEGDGITSPIPGYLVGGPNSSLPTGDAAFRPLVGFPEAKSYLDISGSYATNEIAINWQAPLTVLVGMIEASMNPAVTISPEAHAPQVWVVNHGPGQVSLTNAPQTWSLGDTAKIHAVANTDAHFLGFSGSFRSNVSDTSIALTGDLFAMAHFGYSDTNLVLNGTLSDSTNNWIPMRSYETSNGVWAWSQMRWQDSTLSIEAIQPGQKTADVGVYQDGFELAKGYVYQMDFTARASHDRQICITLYSMSPTRKSLHTICPTLSTMESPYRWSFTPTGNFEPNARLSLEIGGDTSLVWFDNVSLQRISGTRQDDILTKVTQYQHIKLGVAVYGQMVYNLSQDQAEIKLVNLQGKTMIQSSLSAGASYNLQPSMAQQQGVFILQIQQGSQSQAMRIMVP